MEKNKLDKNTSRLSEYNMIKININENEENIKEIENINQNNIFKKERLNLLLIKNNDEITKNINKLEKFRSDIQKKNNNIDLEEYDILNDLQNKILEITYKISKINKI